MLNLFPTFVEAAGLPALPPDQLLQGSSLADVLANPNDQINWKPYAISQFAKATEQSPELHQQIVVSKIALSLAWF